MMPPAGPQCKETHTARCHSRYAWMTRCRASLGEEAVVVVVPSAARLGENFNQARARKKKKKKDHTDSSYLRKECRYNRHGSDSFCRLMFVDYIGWWGVCNYRALVINTSHKELVQGKMFQKNKIPSNTWYR